MKIHVLFVINDGKFFLSHRYGLAKELQASGFEVSIACPSGVTDDQIKAAGFTLYAIPLGRRSLNPFAQIKLMYALYRLYHRLKPDIIHHFSIKPILFGSIAAIFAKPRLLINAPTGLGYVFTSPTLKAKILRALIAKLYYIALNLSLNILIFQNEDDRQVFQQLGLIRKKQTFLIKGAGVDLSCYTPEKEKDELPIVIFPARLLWDKGLQEFIDAVKDIKSRAVCAARFVLVGDIDPGNPATASKKQLEVWVNEGLVEWWGWQDNMINVFHNTHIVCLPSYREGIPKVLLEASACGKPIVTTDAPGCRDVVLDKITGFLVPVQDHKILAERLVQLIHDPQLREEMGQKGRERIQAEFSIEKIVHDTLLVYHQLPVA